MNVHSFFYPAPSPRHSRHKQSVLQKEKAPSSGRFAYAFRVFQGACAFSIINFLHVANLRCIHADRLVLRANGDRF